MTNKERNVLISKTFKRMDELGITQAEDIIARLEDIIARLAEEIEDKDKQLAELSKNNIKNEFDIESLPDDLIKRIAAISVGDGQTMIYCPPQLA